MSHFDIKTVFDLQEIYMRNIKHPLLFGVSLIILSFMVAYFLGKLHLYEISPFINDITATASAGIAAIGLGVIILHFFDKSKRDL